MNVSGLLITVGPGADEAEAALASLGTAPVFQLGERQGQRVVAVLETSDAATARRYYEWAGQLPGVMQVDLAFVYDESESMAGQVQGANG